MSALKRSASPALESHLGLNASRSEVQYTHPAVRRSKRLKATTVAIKTKEEDYDEGLSPLTTSESTDEEVVVKKKTTVSRTRTTRQTASPAKQRRESSPRKAKPIQQALDVPHPTPANWREVYDKIKDMRSRIAAPVDTMGCHRAQLEETTPENQRFSTLVSLMLSSQTKDETTFTAVTKLREAVGGSLSVDAILAADESAIGNAICKVGFWRRKTQYIKQAAQILRDKFNSDVPKTVDELCSLPGVGPKMAFLALQDGWKLNVGIGVDVHVHRITNRLGWHKPATAKPEETRLNLQSWLPIELHPEINALLVGFGQTICTPVGPRCSDCELSNGLCPSARRNVKTKGRKALIATTSTATTASGPKIEIAVEAEVKVEENS
ncbi:DNA glycosylase [Wolfiporia cocos MD-104 SS10]|uniref:Endonuclease III homolog n=1 Tax=Wolfiporia cocos (strain MD-104) TaxID=742152 RepID=A0A2H3J9E9_WOLCO|nr:DNA glycosylase [Wolfiporia cocos MD-104 SS10]